MEYDELIGDSLSVLSVHQLPVHEGLIPGNDIQTKGAGETGRMKNRMHDHTNYKKI